MGTDEHAIENPTVNDIKNILRKINLNKLMIKDEQVTVNEKKVTKVEDNTFILSFSLLTVVYIVLGIDTSIVEPMMIYTCIMGLVGVYISISNLRKSLNNKKYDKV